MKAKEMFEELGYNEFYKHNTYMLYVKPLKENPEYENDYIHLEFNFKDKTFVKTYGDDNSVYEITLEELQAINKQVEELHWNDTTVNIDVKLDDKKVMEVLNRTNTIKKVEE